ncbi:MAG: M20 metallopeptidase family protein [Cetobacterium sp.]
MYNEKLDLNNLEEEVQLIFDELKIYRDRIHSEPELSMKEYKTTDFLYNKLLEFGVDEVIKVKDTGIIATIYGVDKSRGVALRADIDALPIEEESDYEKKSKIKGISHACGHDIHTVSLLGAVKILNKYKTKLSKSIRVIFQPAEELGEGAKYMIENGCLKGLELDGILAFHCWPDLPAGKVYSRGGKVCASSDSFKIIVKGAQGHAAHPHKTIDPIIIAGNIISSIQTIVSRELPPLDTAVISFGTIHGGTKENIISEIVEMTGTIRALDQNIREYIHKRVEEIAIATAKVYRGDAEVFIKKRIPPLQNNSEIANLIKKSIIKNLGEDCYIENPNPSMGAEDFSYYLEKVPGAMYRIGCGFENEKNYSLHSNKFKANEEALKTGVKSLIITAIEMMGEQNE